jgi:hypothetical protein
VTGSTSSTNFPSRDAVQSARAGADNAFNPNTDCFVVVLAPSQPGAAGLLFATYLGGTGNDGGAGIALSQSGTIAVAGTTTSPDFPVTAAMQGKPGGGTDAFVAGIDGAISR